MLTEFYKTTRFSDRKHIRTGLMFATILFCPIWPIGYLKPINYEPDLSKRWKRLDSLIPNRFTFDEFHIAHLTGATRIKEDIYPEGIKSPKWIHIDEEDGYCGALAPVFDMINHSSAPNCMWDYDSDSVKIITLRSIEKDEELFIDYGYRRDRNSLTS